MASSVTKFKFPLASLSDLTEGLLIREPTAHKQMEKARPSVKDNFRVMPSQRRTATQGWTERLGSLLADWRSRKWFRFKVGVVPNIV